MSRVWLVLIEKAQLAKLGVTHHKYLRVRVLVKTLLKLFE